jgi:hypothetical protein
MTDLLMPRRKFLTGLFGLVAAPAIVKAANIMPVKVPVKIPVKILEYGQWQYTEVGVGFSITREEIGDGLWESQMAGMNRALLESFQRTKDIYAANMMNLDPLNTSAERV